MSDWDLDLQRAIFNSLNPVRTARCNISSTRVELSAATRRSTRLEREGIVPVQRNFRSEGKKWNASSSSIPKDTKSTVLTRSVRGAKLPTETKASSTDPGRKEYLHDPLKDTIMSDVILKNTGTIAWNDVIGLTDAKRLLKEAVVLPQLAPELFSGFRCPWRGILLYGPPGTGKTLLAKAVTSEVNATFINVSASTLISKYHGESEKLVRTLFEVAYEKAPSVLFFDEIDTLFSTRSSNEHDALKRLKGQFLSECDGLLSKQNIFVIATTNRPWDIDDALRRRLEKRIYIPLPDAETRISLFKHNLKNTCLEDDVDLNQLADLTQGYSGADINIICREAFMHPVRRLLSSGDFDSDTIKHLREAGELQNNRLLVSMKDFESSIEKTKPSNAQSADCSYEVWTQEYGSV